MRYKDNVQNKINTAINKGELILRGLENRTITPQDTVAKVKEIITILNDVENLVEKETQGLN